MANVIEIKNLTKRFSDGKVAVDNLSLKVKKGDVLGFLGPNGAGKSTTINMITGLLRKTNGEITIFGEDASKKSKMVRQKMGLVPQDIAIYEDLTALENVEFFGGLYGLRGSKLKEACNTALEFVGLTKNAKQKSGTFSGGMKRRLNIACAIVHQPDLIIMDEPTVGIDPQSRNYILDAIEKLNDQGKTIIYCTHYMEEVERISNYIAIVDHGKVIAQGTEAELINMVTDSQNVEIEVSDVSKVDVPGIEQIDGVRNITIEQQTMTVVSDVERNVLDNVLESLMRDGVGIEAVNQQHINLETVFLNMTGRTLRDK